MNNDSKKRTTNRKIIVLSTVVAVIVLASIGVSTWYFIDKAEKEAAAVEEKHDNAKKEFIDLNIEGDADRAARYLVLIDENRKSEALNLYMDAVDKAEHKEDKENLLIELGNISISKNEYDHAVAAAKKRVEIDPTIEAYQYLSIMCISNNNFEGAVEAHRQLIELFDKTHTMELTDELRRQREVYVSELSRIEEVRDLRGTE